MKAVQFKEFGGPEVLEYVDLEKPEPSGREVVIEVKAVGVNYADTARREGEYVVETTLPFIPGAEVAGIVSDVGHQVENFNKGDRVVTLIESKGYAEYALTHEKTLIPIPEGVDFETAVALPLQGLSAYHILKTMGRLEEGETVLIHAAAGGVGTIAVQLAKIFGASKIIATASTEEKLQHAKSMGATHLVNYSEEGWEQKVLEHTDGEGVDVALEMVGGDVFKKTLKCLAPFGRLVIYGVASRVQPKLYPSYLMGKNQSVVGFFLPQIMRKQKLFQQSLKELLTYLQTGQVKLSIGGVYNLSEAQKVHELLEGRQTKGKLVLKP
ncbi:quinone oxidoreductase family protein [Piscibacillus sp. B03]|uniref:quinone oxidoreductase family protein n=1 Tax=Piscibacillus sp. B03 TaxID=3457430 RepID=UPI003FCDE140